MDLATIIGLIGGMLVVLGAISANSGFDIFTSIPSAMIVIGGTLTVTLIKFPITHVFNAFRVASNAFRDGHGSPARLIILSKELATLTRKKGRLALEGLETGDPFFQKALQLLVDGHETDTIINMLQEDMDREAERHQIGVKIFRAIGESAPAFGMIGTLVGLVQMLSNMSDASSIGPAMAIALLTTLYGALLANVVALPIADKLELRSQEEQSLKALILNSIIMIAENKHPMIVEETLLSFIPHKKRNIPDLPAETAANKDTDMPDASPPDEQDIKP